MEIIRHDVNEVQSFRHGFHLISLVNGIFASRDGGSQQQTMPVKNGSEFSQKLGEVLFVLRFARAISSAS